ncbi:MAG: hypothetical protein RLY86_3684 [Pseudomonadota bacterium]|jgi:transposase
MLTDDLPTDLAAAHALILSQRAALAEAEERAREARREAGSLALEIERLKLQLAKARRALYGQSSERARLLVEQLELQLEELEETRARAETRPRN